jgi:hypothetical protein
MKKFNMDKLKPMSTSMSKATTLDPDENGEAIDQREYRSILAPSCTSQRHCRTSSSLCVCVHAFRLPHALCNVKQFSESSGISSKLSLGFGILLLLHWILLTF